MTFSRSQANFLASNCFLDGSALVQLAKGLRLLAEDVSHSKVTFLAVDVLVVNGRFVTKPRERIVAFFLSEHGAHPQHVHVSWPCSVPKSFGSSCLHEKEQRAAEKKPWQASEVRHVSDIYFESQTVFG